MNPAAGVFAPAPGRLEANRFRRPRAAERTWFFRSGRRHPAGPTFDFVPLAFLSFVSVAGTLAAPALRHNPLLLVALSPRLPFLVLAAPRVGFLPFLLVGTVRLCLADPFHFRLGRRLAPPVAGPCRLRGRLARHRLARPASAAAVLLRPNGRHLALAGAVGLRTAVVVALDLTGTVVYLVGLHGATALFG
jgi:hypothetical protein